MSTQNLISATITPEMKEKIMQSLAVIRQELNFLISLPAESKKELFKAGPTLLPFVEKAYYVATNFPDIIPKTLDIEEFKRDVQLSRSLNEIMQPSKEINDALVSSFVAANSDAGVVALEIYTIVQMYKDKVPGLNVVATEMAEFFKRSKRKKDDTETTA